MSEDWKTAYEAWLKTTGRLPSTDPGSSSTLFGQHTAFRAGYLAHAETVERLRGVLSDLLIPIDDEQFDGGFYIDTAAYVILARRIIRQALADLQPKETSR